MRASQARALLATDPLRFVDAFRVALAASDLCQPSEPSQHDAHVRAYVVASRVRATRQAMKASATK